jgi:hypothetical protein
LDHFFAKKSLELAVELDLLALTQANEVFDDHEDVAEDYERGHQHWLRLVECDKVVALTLPHRG